MNLLLFWDIRKTKGGMNSVIDIEQMSRYLKFSVIQRKVDWLEKDPEKKFSLKEHELRICEL